MYFRGKIVGDARYVHKDVIGLLDPSEIKVVKSAAKFVEEEHDWNVVKIELKQVNKVSFLD